MTITLALPLALGIALSLSSGCSKKETADANPSEVKTAEAQSDPAATTTGVSEHKMAMPSQKPGVLSPLSPEIVEMIASNQTESVEVQVYSLTNSLDLTATQKAQALLSILPSFNRDGQRMVAHSVVSYVDDSVHSLISAPLLEGKLDPQILSVFMTDTLTRPDSVRMPVLNSLAATKDHPLQIEARELLAALSKPHSSVAQNQDHIVQQQIASKPD